jgi:hypothetical protein
MTRLVQVALVAGLLAAPAAAQTTHGAAPRPDAAVRLANGTTFNWLVKKSTRGMVSKATLVSSDNVPRSARKVVYGRGSYICSPAGFGKKSSCYAR